MANAIENCNYLMALLSIENIITQLIGDNDNNVLLGNELNNRIIPEGNDTLTGGKDDNLHGGKG